MTEQKAPAMQLDKSNAHQWPVLDDCIKALQYESGRQAGVVPFLFTWAIVADFNSEGYGQRWCYETLQDALGALDDWDGEGEPQGWHRHLPSGRRRDHDGNDLGVW